MTRPAAVEEHFSFPLFLATVAATLAGLAGLVRWLLPAWWMEQFSAGPLHWVAAFLLISLLNCFVEYFFHRYLLHAAPMPVFRHFYRQHTLHHGLTHIVRRPRPGGGGYYVIENRFPIETPDQGEASFFPWYSLVVFALALTPLLGALQWLLPQWPWLLGGYAALATSLVLYELLHSINHWPMTAWQPLIEHPRWGRLWRSLYSFHLRHHAVPDCNESVSGWFGLPVADWLFRTCVMPETIYAEGEAWDPEKFRHPAPCWPIARLDRWVAARAARRRSGAVAASPGPARYSRGEEIALWAAYGLGLGVSVAGLMLLIVFGSLHGPPHRLLGFSLFGLSVVALAALSTLDHAFRRSRLHPPLRRLKYTAGILLAAGTIAPFLFLKAPIPDGGLWLFGAGVLSYLAALGFNAWRSLPYHRPVREVFVLGGYACHLLAVLLFLLPRAG